MKPDSFLHFTDISSERKLEEKRDMRDKLDFELCGDPVNKSDIKKTHKIAILLSSVC